MFNLLGLADDKKVLKNSIPKQKHTPQDIQPREKSARIKKIAAKQEMERIEEDVGSGMKRQSPSWVGQMLPTENIQKEIKLLSNDEMDRLMPVPKMNLAINEVIAKHLDYYKGNRFIQRLSSERDDFKSEERLQGEVNWSNMRSMEEGKVSSQKLVSVDLAGDLLAFGDMSYVLIGLYRQL